MITSILFLPHGMQIIPSVEEYPKKGFSKINEEMLTLISKFENENDTSDILLLTPHGYNLAESVVLYNQENFIGSIYKINEDSNVIGEELRKIEIKGNMKLNENIIQLLRDKNNIELLSHGFSAYPMMLNWGEVVPINYIENKEKNYKYSILCYPRLRHSNLKEIKKINKSIVEILMQIKKDIILVISGDLSHVHKNDGPYGFDESCIRFDNLVNDWTRNGKDETMEEILLLQPKALACGMSGLNLIHQIRKKEKYSLKYHFYEVPTYFGMGGYWWKKL